MTMPREELRSSGPTVVIIPRRGMSFIVKFSPYAKARVTPAKGQPPVQTSWTPRTILHLCGSRSDPRLAGRTSSTESVSPKKFLSSPLGRATDQVQTCPIAAGARVIAPKLKQSLLKARENRGNEVGPLSVLNRSSFGASTAARAKERPRVDDPRHPEA